MDSGIEPNRRRPGGGEAGGRVKTLPPDQPRATGPVSSHQHATPSSSTEGFFQQPPRILNQLADDAALQRAFTLFLPNQIRTEVLPDFQAFGDKVLSKQVLDWIADAEKNLPYIRPFDAWGRRHDELVTSEGWRKLSAIGVQEGMVSIGYENEHLQFGRTYQFLKYLVWCGSAVWTTCPYVYLWAQELTSP